MVDDLSTLLKRVITSAVVEAMRDVEASGGSSANERYQPRLDSSMTLLTVPEVAKALAVSQRQVHLLTQSGELPSFRLGRLIRYRASSLRDWIVAREMGIDAIAPESSKVEASQPTKRKPPNSSKHLSDHVTTPSEVPQTTAGGSSRRPAPDNGPRAGRFQQFVTALGVSYESLGPVSKGDIELACGASRDRLTGWLFRDEELPEEALAKLRAWVLARNK